MTRKPRRFCGVLLVLNLGSFGAGPAMAAAIPDEEVTVHDAPYTIHRQVFGRPMTGQTQTEEIAITKGVSYADLDLSKEADVDILKERIREAAVDACRQLHRRYPGALNQSTGKQGCVQGATEQAMAQLDALRTLAR